MTVATQIKTARLALGWSQQELADKIGVTRAAVSQWEKKAPKLKPEIIIELSRLLGKPKSAFTVFGGDTVGTADPDKHAIILLNWEELTHVKAGGQVLSQAIKTLRHVEVSKDISKRAIAFVLADDSMSPRFEVGEEIVIDPGIRPVDDERDPDFVLVRMERTGEHLFRRYRQRDGSPDAYDLVAENSDWDTISVSPRNPAEVLGTLVQHTVKRRKKRNG